MVPAPRWLFAVCAAPALEGNLAGLFQHEPKGKMLSFLHRAMHLRMARSTRARRFPGAVLAAACPGCPGADLDILLRAEPVYVSHRASAGAASQVRVLHADTLHLIRDGAVTAPTIGLDEMSHRLHLAHRLHRRDSCHRHARSAAGSSVCSVHSLPDKRSSYS